MDVNKTLDNMIQSLKKLSDISTDEHIKGGACGIYPGPRCPLALITNVLGEITGIAALVVGTAECTYYNKNISLMFDKADEINQTWSYSIDSKEVIFGCRQGVIEALKEIDETGVEGIVLISACVPEMIGEDFEGIIFEANEVLKAKVVHVEAAHFKSYSTVPSKEKALLSLVEFMKKQETVEKTVNILGSESGLLKQGELVRLLNKQGVEVNCYIPYNLTVEDLQKAPSVALSIVTDMAALPLAKKMQKKFGIPYIPFFHLLNPEEIRESYKEIGKYLGIHMEEEVEALYENAMSKISLGAQTLRGRTIAIGYTVLDPVICADFFSILGMEPMYIEADYFFKEDQVWRKNILDRGYDPYVGRTFNFNTTEAVLRTFQPDYFFGFGALPQKDMKTNIIKYDTALSEIGFEQSVNMISKLIESVEHQKTTKE